MPTSRLNPAQLLLLCLLSSLSACQLSPLARFQQNPEYQFKIVSGEVFKHQVIEKISKNGEGRALHVYIEGDGRPWWTRYQVASDPTPRQLPVLKLMAIDSHPAIYLGRPCYFGVDDTACAPLWWTQGRYGKKVVDSMNRALDRVAENYQTIILIGHSGGGALAMLMAAQRDDVDTVVTLAGNLDIDRWTQHHGYSALSESLNPVDYPLPDTIQQKHFIGSKDTVIPSAMQAQSAASLGSEISLIDKLDHSCCWQAHWPGILEQLD